MTEFILNSRKLLTSHEDLKKWLVQKESDSDPITSENFWFLLVLWDDKIMEEFKTHEEFKNALDTKMFLGRMFQDCALKRQWDLGGMLNQMDWRDSFLMFDVTGTNFGTCGEKNCVRVQETPTCDGAYPEDFPQKLKMWDLVISPECRTLAEEMLRLRNRAVRTTVVIWNTYLVDRYPNPWQDAEDQVLGEIWLKPTTKAGKILSVLIFPHETVAEANCSEIVSCFDDGNDSIIKVYSTVGDAKNDGDSMAVFSTKKGTTADPSPDSEIKCCLVEIEEDSDADSEITLRLLQDDNGEFVPVTDDECGSVVSTASSVDVLIEANEQIRRMASKMIACGMKRRY